MKVIRRIHEMFPAQAALQAPHILDLAETGYIKPHVDNVKASGELLSGLSLLSPALMDLIHEESKEVVTIFLPPRSLYLMTREGRYEVEMCILPFSYHIAVCTRYTSGKLLLERRGVQAWSADLRDVPRYSA